MKERKNREKEKKTSLPITEVLGKQLRKISDS